MTHRTRKMSVILGAVALFIRIGLAADYYPFRDLTDPAKQIETLSQQCEEKPTPENLTTLGWLTHIYRNDTVKARELLETALELEPENLWARYGLCLIDEIGGDFDHVLSNSLALCKTSPEHPLALLALLNVRSLFGNVAGFHNRVETILRPLLEEERSGSVQFDEMCREILAAISRSKGGLDELKRLTRDRNFIREWRIVGPFGEHPNLSFLSKWEPESDGALRSRYKIGDRVLRRRGYSSEYGALRPHWAKRGVHYAETFLRSASAQDVIFRISSPFPVELFLRGRCIYTKDLIRRHQPVTEYVKTRLVPGSNRLLVKCLLGSWDLSPNVSYKALRLKCLTSESIPAPTVQVFRHPYGSPAISVRASGRRSGELEQVVCSAHDPSSLKFFSELLNENPDDPLALGICGILEGVQEDVQGAKRLLRASLNRAPSYCYFNYVLGVIAKEDSSIPTQVRRSEARARFDAALAGAKVFPLARFESALLDIHEDKDPEAIEKLKECIARSPEFYSWHETLYNLYQRKQWQNEQRQQLDKILSLGIESCAPNHLAENYYRTTKQHDRLADTIKKLQETHIYPEFVARHAFQSGQDSTAIAEYVRLKTALPEKQAIRRSLIELYERNGRWVEAGNELREALKVFPDDLFFWKKLAEWKGHTGRAWGERQVWKRILRQNPVDQDARRALMDFGLKDMLDEYDIPSWDYIHDEGIREQYAGVSSAIIIDQAVDEIYSNCSSRKKIHQLILLNDRKAIDTWGELDIPEDELLELRTIKKDGTIVEPEPPQGGKTTFSMGGLQEGDFIELKYVTRTSADPNRPRRYLGERFFFQSVDIPMHISQYIVIVPATMNLTYEEVNSPPRLSVMRKNGGKIYKWETRDVPAIPQEPLAAPETEFLPFVRVGVNYDENAEILRHQDQNVAMTKPTDEIEQTTAEILTNCPNDNESRARAIYAFVNKEVRGGGGSAYLGRSASETLADRNGDRLSLARAMLDAAGVKSRMLVVRGELTPVSEVFPEAFHFALLAIPGRDDPYACLLDFSDRYLPFGYVRTDLQGGIAIPLQDPCSSDFALGEAGQNLHDHLLKIPRFSPSDNHEQRTLTASVGEDGAVDGIQIQDYTGDRAAGLRTALFEAEEYQIREFIERMANVSFRAASLTHHKVENLSDPETPLRIEYGFRAPNFGRVAGNEMLLDQVLPPLRLGARFASLEVRKTPLQISRDLNSRFQAVVKLPPGARVVQTPSPLEIQSDFGYYLLRFAEKRESIHIEYDFHLKAQRLSPRRYPEFADFCRTIDTAEREEIKVRLAPPGPLSTEGERAEDKDKTKDAQEKP